MIGVRLWKSYYGGRLVRIGRHRIVKENPYLRLAEARAMEFVAENTSIPVPRVLDIFTVDKRLNIVMEYIDAPSLDTVWPDMSLERRELIVTQLKDFIIQLRALPPPHPGRVHAIDESGLFDPRQQNEPFGPFSCVADFHTFIGVNYIQEHLPKENPELSDSLEKCATRSYRTTFTHGDLAPRNILVKGDKIVGIIDWECAGWYPEYWEYTSCYRSNLDCRSFWDLARDKRIMGSYSEELLVDQHLSSVVTRC